MSVRIFFPRVPDDVDEFLKVLGQVCPSLVNQVKLSRRCEGGFYCIVTINYAETNGKCGNDIIDELSGKTVANTTLSPRFYIESTIFDRIHDTDWSNKEIREVKVTYYHKDFYYLQRKSDSDNIQIVRDKLRSLYKTFSSNMLTVLKFEDLVEGKLYVTTFLNDKELYRVKLLKKSQRNKIMIYFIDFGNTDVRDCYPIIALGKDLANIPPLAQKCVIEGVRIIDERKHDLVSREVVNRIFQAKLCTNVKNLECTSSVDFLNFSIVSYRDYLILANIAEEVNAEIIEEVMMSYMVSFEQFYVHRYTVRATDCLNKILKLTDYLTSNLKDDLQYIDDFTIYLTESTADGKWYRCKIIENHWNKSTQPYCVVQFIDYGNTEKKYNLKDLKPLTTKWCQRASKLATMIPCAHRCSFSKHLVNKFLEIQLDVPLFYEDMIVTKKIVKLHYVDYDGKWIVNNVIFENDVDLLMRYRFLKRRHVTHSNYPDLYRLSNIESIHKIWFQLVFTSNVDRKKQLQIIKDWNANINPEDLKMVSKISLDRLYCALNADSHLFRCRVISKNIDRVIVQDIDSGLHHDVKMASLFLLSSYLSALSPMSRPYKLEWQVPLERKEDVERKIVQLLDNQLVELDLLSDSVVRDVFIKNKSLIESLSEYYVEKVKGHEYANLPLLETELNKTDFRRVRVLDMNKVPLDIALENSQMRFLMKLFHKEEGDECIFDCIWDILSDCDQMFDVDRCGGEVDNLALELKSVKSSIRELVEKGSSKYRDVLSLLEKRKCVCDSIYQAHISLQAMLSKTTTLDQKVLKVKMEKLIKGISTILDILNIRVSTTTPVHDMVEVHKRITQFHQSSLYKDSILPQIRESSFLTEYVITKLRDVLYNMVKGYDFHDTVPTISDVTAPFVDVIYELHPAIKSHKSLLINSIISLPDVCITTLLTDSYIYLKSKKAVIDALSEKFKQLQSLQEEATLITTEDSEVIHIVESIQKRILILRSDLRHSITDFEDAEELDLKEKQRQLMVIIADQRRSLQIELRSSKNIINSDSRFLMSLKPEVQLKNQSILFHDQGLPVFMWDSAYFELTPDGCSEDCLLDSVFVDEKIKVKKISLLGDSCNTTFRNISECSFTLASISQDFVPVIPILFLFLSKESLLDLYLTVPQFTTLSLSSIFNHIEPSVCSVVTFFKSVIDQLLVLWHQSYVYSEDDLKHGILLICHRTEEERSHICLPLPLTSIVNRTHLLTRRDTNLSLNIYMKKLGTLFRETLTHPQLILKKQRNLARIVRELMECGEVAETKLVSDALAKYMIDVTIDMDERNMVNRDLEAEEELEYLGTNKKDINNKIIQIPDEDMSVYEKKVKNMVVKFEEKEEERLSINIKDLKNKEIYLEDGLGINEKDVTYEDLGIKENDLGIGESNVNNKNLEAKYLNISKRELINEVQELEEEDLVSSWSLSDRESSIEQVKDGKCDECFNFDSSDLSMEEC